MHGAITTKVHRLKRHNEQYFTSPTFEFKELETIWKLKETVFKNVVISDLHKNILVEESLGECLYSMINDHYFAKIVVITCEAYQITTRIEVIDCVKDGLFLVRENDLVIENIETSETVYYVNVSPSVKFIPAANVPYLYELSGICPLTYASGGEL